MKITYLVVIAISFGACVQKKVSPSNEPVMEITLPHQPVEGEYIIASIVKDGSLQDVSAKNYAFKFDATTNRLHVKICNSMNGSYNTERGNTMTLGPVMSTKMYCDEIAWEDAIGKHFTDIDNYSIEDGLLHLKKVEKSLIVLRPKG